MKNLKKMILTLSLLFTALTSTTQAAQLTLTLDNGSQVALTQDACIDPVTGRAEPCFLAPTAASQDRDACYNPSTGKLEPCLSAARAEQVANEACWNPETGRLEPCF